MRLLPEGWSSTFRVHGPKDSIQNMVDSTKQRDAEFEATILPYSHHP